MSEIAQLSIDQCSCSVPGVDRDGVGQVTGLHTEQFSCFSSWFRIFRFSTLSDVLVFLQGWTGSG